MCLMHIDTHTYIYFFITEKNKLEIKVKIRKWVKILKMGGGQKVQTSGYKINVMGCSL